MADESASTAQHARTLHAEGFAPQDIARSLNVPLDDVLGWCAEDPPEEDPELTADEDYESDEARDRLRARLESELEALTGEASLRRFSSARRAYPCTEDRMLKVRRILRLLSDDAPDVGLQLKTMRAFVHYCLQSLSEDEMPPIRKAVRGFLDDLKERNS